jgi:hypothetical protein
MNQGKLVFSQLMAFLPLSTFRRCVATHRGDHKVQDFTCMDQFLTMAFAKPLVLLHKWSNNFLGKLPILRLTFNKFSYQSMSIARTIKQRAWL